MAGARPARTIGGLRAFFSHKVLVSAIFTFLFLASFSAILSSSSKGSDDGRPASGEAAAAGIRRTFLALNSDPLRTRLDLIYRQAADHVALVHAYASYARRLKLDNSHQLRLFEDLASGFSDLASRLESDHPADEDALRPLEKEAKDRIKLARQVISEHKESFDTQLKIQKLRDTIFAVGEQLHRARKLGTLSSRIAAGSTPKSLHCLAMRLMEERIAHPQTYRRLNPPALSDPEMYHYAIFSDNVIAVSVVVNSAIKNAEEPWRHVFHVVTDQMYVAAMQVWFIRRPPANGGKVEVRSLLEFAFLNSSYSPVVQQIEGGRRDLVLLDYLRFYLPEIFPKLRRIVYLEDDVVVQKDLAGLWNVDLDGKVNGAVEMCFGGFRRYSRYMNFSHPAVKDRFGPRACAWNYGVNVFDLDAWRRERCTQQFHRYLKLNEDGTMWDSGNVLPAGLMTFYTATKPIEKSWHVMGLGYNPNVSPEEIRNAAVVHFNGNMKPWLDVALNQYKNLWTKYVDTEMEFLPLCNFGL
ncbi:putative galacturonosyltransferase 9 [Apostasia shenzhenica]|uniref:Hexosyltransferase n=1 Tax=Apostasia shenzhenica TaxID=1088818 RepID=A0A2I0A5B4_9ASPA|nr:putative galacturonosyltransferase 9 [Apostasia shenzhenica]